MIERTNKITLFASIGSIISGFVASLCCIGPLVFVVLGLGGAAFFAKLEQYKLIFGLVSLAFLSLGFFFAYRGGEECSSGTSCAAIDPKRRKLNRIILWIAAILVVAFILLPNIIGFLLLEK
ncbi:MAG: mercury transporter MerT [Candidatus Dadabacteria bacterium]